MASSVNPTDGVLQALVDRWGSEMLFQVRDQVRDVAHHPGYDALRALVEDALSNAQTRLIRGPTLEQVAYARAMGFLEGLEMLLRVPEVIAERAEKREAQLEKAADAPSDERTG